MLRVIPYVFFAPPSRNLIQHELFLSLSLSLSFCLSSYSQRRPTNILVDESMTWITARRNETAVLPVRTCMSECMRACVRACVHAYDKRRVRLAHIIIHTPHMFLHIVHHEDFWYAQRTIFSPRRTIINAHPARSRSMMIMQIAKIISIPPLRVFRCTSWVKVRTVFFSRLIQGPMDDRESRKGRERERERRALYRHSLRGKASTSFCALYLRFKEPVPAAIADNYSRVA